MEIVRFVKTDEIAEKISKVFESEKQVIAKHLPAATIEHVGGTSISGSLTQGDLDINIRIKKEDFEKAKDILSAFYSSHRSETWPAGFACFKDETRGIDILLTTIGGVGDYFVAQREYLRNHPEVLSQLNSLKEQFQGKDKSEYGKTKGEFFEKLLLSVVS